MPELVVFLAAAALFAYEATSRRLERLWITAPLAFLGLGILLGPVAFGVIDVPAAGHGIEILAEATLLLVLFTDAARIDLAALRRSASLPLRLLAFGMPLALGIGGVLAAILFPDWSLWQWLLLAALLVPTDAALGQAVVEEPGVPVRMRQSLNVESGLNDGLALPLVLFLATCAATPGAASGWDWLGRFALQITLGPLVGIGVGSLGQRAIVRAMQREWIESRFERLAVLALPFGAYAGAELIGGNGFIAGFVAGAAYGRQRRRGGEEEELFTRLEAKLLVQLTFLILGCALVADALAVAGWRHWLMAVAALIVMRPVAVMLALLGSGLRLPSVCFLAWFGPRGTATLIFALLVQRSFEIPVAESVLTIAVLTILLSTVLHGLSALPAARAYAALADERYRDDAVEFGPAHEHATR